MINMNTDHAYSIGAGWSAAGSLWWMFHPHDAPALLIMGLLVLIAADTRSEKS
jgi:hypothetical protein